MNALEDMVKAYDALPADENPSEVAFLLTDGTKVGFGDAPTHGEALEEILGEDSFARILNSDYFLGTIEFLRLTGAVRYAHGSGPPKYHVVREPTAKQLGILIDDHYSFFGGPRRFFEMELERKGKESYVSYQSEQPSEKEIRAFMRKNKAPPPVGEPEEGERTKRVCSYCQKFMGYANFNKGGITHGICKPCFKKVMEDEED